MTTQELVDALIKIQKLDVEVVLLDLDNFQWDVGIVKFEGGLVRIFPSEYE